MQMKIRRLMLFFLVFFALVNPVQGASFLTSQGDCLEDDYDCGSQLHGVSADGSVAFGSSISYGDNSPLLWFQSRGEERLAFAGSAMCASKDGSIIYGMRYTGEGAYAFKWTKGGGTSYIEEVAEPHDISYDGSVGVGYVGVPARWTQSNGVIDLRELSDDFGVALAVSSDGSIVVGYNDEQAFRWTESEGMTGLGYLPGASSSVAYDISGNGSIVVGKSGSQAFRWTESEGMTGLGALPGTSDSVAYGISRDGSIIVGKSGNQAFIWDAANGMRNLKNILANTYGLDMTGRDLGEARSISADGKTIVGNTITDVGYNRRYTGWIASLDTPDQPCQYTPGPGACTSSCPCGEGEGDCDSDSDCEAGLTCVQDVGANYGWPASRDVCEAVCPEFVAGPDACTSSCPCGEGEGDCDSDADCEAGLICVENVGADYGWPASRDVCEADCPEFVAGPDACTSSCPCGEGEGDCDSDADCEAGLTCVQNVGAEYGWTASRDVCEVVCPEFVAGPDACTSSCPCDDGEGDCDSDDDCKAGLICVENVGADYGWTASRDVCQYKPLSVFR